MNILVVDDKKSVRDTISKFLVSLGHSVNTAVNGLDGFEKAQKTPYHLYIIDHLMPLMNGIVLSRNLKKTPFCAKTPILFMTTQGIDSVERLPEFILFSRIISKPINETTFISVVESLTNIVNDEELQRIAL
ncbi:response regulator [Candidatus Colwellia aromaticivorans]|uniref:response regulator n=1 Tax=Candidatus Colwellia aromaticivorans TaxID=2267621 RepID=UPI000DF40C01|nr:response regulator [Candidatus Colwellia aromaticivorans]